jgi:SAM-dependent methyltransferase
MHNPEILGSIENIEELLREKGIKPDCIIALEVMEHVQDPYRAIKSCRAALSQGGLLIISTPWVIPIHDRPNDFLRFTPAALNLMLNDFANVRILARGNYYDSLVALMLRGLFSGGKTGKLIMALGVLLSLVSRTPKVHQTLEDIDSTIGYVALASDKLLP